MMTSGRGVCNYGDVISRKLQKKQTSKALFLSVCPKWKCTLVFLIVTQTLKCAQCIK